MSALDVRVEARSLATDAPSIERSHPRVVTISLCALVVLGVALRLLWSSRNGASFDESFTAMAGRHSIGGVLDVLRTSDSHPPLDYLLRAPFARAGASDLVMRAPSLLFSGAALALFAWWMRSRGIAGVVAVALMAVSPFQIMYGTEARMYALLELLGVVAAVLAERWLREPRDWHAYAVALLVLVGVFDHVSGWLLAGGLFAVAGLRRDRAALRWRVAILTALVVWAFVWGSAFLAQAGTTHASWIAPTTASSVVEVLSSLVTTQQGISLIVVILVAAGFLIARATDPMVARIMVCMGALPFTAAAVIGLFTPFFIDRSVTVCAWVPYVAVGFVLQWAWSKAHLVAIAVALAIAVLVLPAAGSFVRRHWEYDASVDRLLAVARNGDVVATVPDWYGPLVDWRVGVRGFGAANPARLPELPSSHAIRVGSAIPTGRAWILSFSGDHRTFPGLPRCAPTWSDGVTDVTCVVVHQ